MTEVEVPNSVVPRQRVWPLAVKAYHAPGEMGVIPEKTEGLYVQVYHKAPKSPFHGLLMMRLLEWLQRALPPGPHVQPGQPITSPDSEPELDLSVVCGSIEDYASEHPRTAELVIELCVSSHEYDRSKLRAYASADVKEVWLVLAPEKQIEVHRRPVGEGFTEHAVHGPGGRVASASVAQFAVELDALFAK